MMAYNQAATATSTTLATSTTTTTNSDCVSVQLQPRFSDRQLATTSSAVFHGRRDRVSGFIDLRVFLEPVARVVHRRTI